MLQIEFAYKQIIDDLNKLDEGLQGKAIARALTPAVKPITQKMKTIVPTGETGSLRQSIGKRTISKGGRQRLGLGDSVAVIIGPNRTKYKGKKIARRIVGVFLEYGTKHIDPVGFMQRSLESGESGMRQRFFQGLQSYLNKISD